LDAEHGFTALLSRPALSSALRTAAVIGAAQGRLLGRLDPRGAFTMLQPALSAEPSSPALEARMHVVASLLFSTPDGSLFDEGRSAIHAMRARRILLPHPQEDLIGLPAIAELLCVARRGDPAAYLSALRACEPELRDATSQVVQCLSLEVRAVGRHAADDLDGEAEVLGSALDRARQIQFAACEARVLARQARRALEIGDLASCLARIDEGTAALAAAGAVRSWVHAALAETRLAACQPGSRPPLSFHDVARGVPRMATRSPAPSRRAPEASEIALAAVDLGPARDLASEIAKLAPSRATVLVVGGDAEAQLLVARSLHESSHRSPAPFVTLDCSATDPARFEEILFGGPAYAGAQTGLLHAAGRGTLYVAAIEALPLALQPPFLRQLDEPRSARVVASTAVDLARSVRAGRFRADLGERLGLVQILLARV